MFNDFQVNTIRERLDHVYDDIRFKRDTLKGDPAKLEQLDRLWFEYDIAVRNINQAMQSNEARDYNKHFLDVHLSCQEWEKKIDGI